MNPQNPSQTPPPQPAPPPQPNLPVPPEDNVQHQVDPNTGQPVHNPLAVMQSGEQLVCEIKRHPIGIFGVYGIVGFMLVILAVIVFAVIPSVGTGANESHLMGLGAVAFMLIALISLGFVFIANKVYWGNRWIVTTDSITQVSQTGLFSKQSGQLSLANLEDITAEQNGILTHLFNYGVIKAETAGERSKFTFLYCPNPTYYAQQILNAREQFEQNRQTAG